jgi:hypothetical protein
VACVVDNGRSRGVLQRGECMSSRDTDFDSFVLVNGGMVREILSGIDSKRLFEHGIWVGRVHYASLVCVRWSLPWRFQHSRKASICVEQSQYGMDN